MSLVLSIRQLDVQVGDPHLAQLPREVLVVAGGLFSLVLVPVEGAAGGEVNANLVETREQPNIKVSASSLSSGDPLGFLTRY